jgi:hypothetical protein
LSNFYSISTLTTVIHTKNTYYVKSQIADLLQNKMDISVLVITKSLNKGAEYALGLGGKAEDYKMNKLTSSLRQG